MTAQPSQTAIWNKTLALLGTAKRITSPTDGSPLAKQLLAVWDMARDEVLADHPWNEAVRRTDLPASADYIPSNEYALAYELPGDCLRWLPWRRDHENYFEGEQEGRFILSNAGAPIYVRYIARLEDVARWSPGLSSSVAAKLARYSAKAITGQSGMIDRMEGVYQDELRKAKRQDGLATGQRNATAEFRSSWLDARERAGSGG